MARGTLAGVLFELDSIVLDGRPTRRGPVPAAAVIGGVQCAGLQTRVDLAAVVDDAVWEQALESALPEAAHHGSRPRSRPACARTIPHPRRSEDPAGPSPSARSGLRPPRACSRRSWCSWPAATGWLPGRFTWHEVVHVPRTTVRRLAELAGWAVSARLRA